MDELDFEELTGMTFGQAEKEFSKTMARAVIDGMSLGHKIIGSNFSQQQWELCREMSRNNDQALMRMAFAYFTAGLVCLGSTDLPKEVMYSKIDPNDALIENIIKKIFNDKIAR